MQLLPSFNVRTVVRAENNGEAEMSGDWVQCHRGLLEWFYFFKVVNVLANKGTSMLQFLLCKHTSVFRTGIE
jgi:hypothetical protein